MQRKLWSEDEDEFLKACIEAGWYHKEIALELDRTVGSIQGRTGNLNIKSNNFKAYTNKEVDVILEDRNLVRLENYINNSTKIKFKCLKCSNIWKAQPSNIFYGKGCPSCANNLILTNKEFDKKLINRSIKRIDNYIDSHTKINFKCLACNNIWDSIPTNILSGRGCPNCAIYGFKENKPAVTYCIYFKELDLYKVGITNNFISRMKQFGYKPEIIFVREFELGKDAKELETQWLENIKDYKINTGELKSGNTETFKYGY